MKGAADEGCVWVGLWGGRAVHRYTPDGRLDAMARGVIMRFGRECAAWRRTKQGGGRDVGDR